MQWTEKVDARTRLATELKTRAETTPLVRLKMRDLDALIAHGLAARQADREQQAQLAEASVLHSGRAAEAKAVSAHERTLRDVVPAVVADLSEAGQSAASQLLQRVSFARFRLRGLEPADDASPPTAEETEALRSIAQVERKDSATLARSVSGFCGFVLAPGREVLAEAFAARDLSRAQLEAMAADADAFVALGRNRLQAAEATQREHDAVAAQQRVWTAVRRLVRAAVADDPRLSQLFAAC